MFKPAYPSLWDYMYNMVFTFLSYIVKEREINSANSTSWAHVWFALRQQFWMTNKNYLTLLKQVFISNALFCFFLISFFLFILNTNHFFFNANWIQILCPLLSVLFYILPIAIYHMCLFYFLIKQSKLKMEKKKLNTYHTTIDRTHT